MGAWEGFSYILYQRRKLDTAGGREGYGSLPPLLTVPIESAILGISVWSPKVGIVIKNTISKFSKTKNLTQKDPQKLQKLKTYMRRPQIKKFYKTHPPKVGIVIENTISKFSNTKN